MSKNKDQKIKISCVGMSANEVTGSSYLIECPTGEKILLDCGLYQKSNKYESWKANQKKFKFKPSELTFVAISHLNIDHLGLIPLLYDRGAKCKTYMSYDNLDFVRPMLKDCAKIMERDAESFGRRYKRSYEPLYTNESVESCLDKFLGVEYNNIIKITDNVSVQFIPSGHIYGACQIILYIKKPSGNIKKISYSGDLGNTIFEQPFVREFEPVIKSNMYIGECTYNVPNRSVKKEQRNKDLELIKNIVNQVCVDGKGILLIPTFALQRTETILYTLYNLFKDDKDFNVQVVLDSPLAVSILDIFKNNLEGCNADMIKDILAWKNLKIIRSVEESQLCLSDKQPKIICSSSGMLTQGRSVMYLKKILPRSNCCILTCGYMAEGTIGWKIKNNPIQKTITIDGKPYPNRCDIKSLKSFSSHMQYEELMNYYVNLANNGCEVIWLVHSDENKKSFKKELENRIKNINKTTKVVSTNYETTGRI